MSETSTPREDVRLNRASLLKKTAAGAVGLSALGGALGRLNVLDVRPAYGAGPDTLTFLSPLATLDTMFFYDIVVANVLGYFKHYNLNVPMLPGTGGTNATLGVAQHQADIGWPSPGILTYSLDQGVPVYAIWQSEADQYFDYCLPLNTKIKTAKDLAHKTIALHNEADFAISNPILAAAGVDPKTVKYVTFGEQWPQAVATGQADAGLVWEGLRGQLNGEGIKLKYLLGKTFSNHPSNVYAVRKADLNDKHKRDALKRWLTAMTMGNEFARANPRAAAQITYLSRPALKDLFPPKTALESMCEIATGHSLWKRRGKGWGYLDPIGWQSYLDTIYKLKQVKKHYKTSDVFTNAFVGPVNAAADAKKAHADAKAFKVNRDFAKLKVPNYPL
jgi:NitT/TauT family transport system substrate-binding protein